MGLDADGRRLKSPIRSPRTLSAIRSPDWAFDGVLSSAGRVSVLECETVPPERTKPHEASIDAPPHGFKLADGY